MVIMCSMGSLMRFTSVTDRGSETCVIVTHGLRQMAFDPSEILQLSKDIAGAFPSVDVAEFHRNDELLFKRDGSLDLAASYLNRKALELKKTKQRVISLGVSLGGLISGIAVQDRSSALDSVITISMPTDLEGQPLPSEAKLRASEFTKRLQNTLGVMNCIYGGRDSTVSSEVVSACSQKTNGLVQFHKIPMMTHRSIGHHKAEIKAVLDKLI